jgi:hypothetical protein
MEMNDIERSNCGTPQVRTCNGQPDMPLGQGAHGTYCGAYNEGFRFNRGGWAGLGNRNWRAYYGKGLGWSGWWEPSLPSAPSMYDNPSYPPQSQSESMVMSSGMNNNHLLILGALAVAGVALYMKKKDY